MKKITLLPPCGALAIALFILVASSYSSAQTAADTSPAKSASPEELNQAELLKSYLQLREQLHATQLAIANNRLEAEATARAQASTIAEKLEAITSAMEAERERHRIELERSNADRERYRAESPAVERGTRTPAGGDGAFQSCRALGRRHLWGCRPPLDAAHAVVPMADLAPPDRNHRRPTQVSRARLARAVDRGRGRFVGSNRGAFQPTPDVRHRTDGAADFRIRAGLGSTPLTGVAQRRRRGNGPPCHRGRGTGHAHRRLDREGTIAPEIGKTVEALACYNEILRLDLNHPEALVKRGAALERLKQDDEAIQCYDRAIKADRKMTLAYLHKGAVCNRLERYEEAVKCYEQALLVEAEG